MNKQHIKAVTIALGKSWEFWSVIGIIIAAIFGFL